MRLIEFEKSILKKYLDDKDFIKFLKKTNDISLIKDENDDRIVENINENNYIVDSSLVLYMNELIHIKKLTESEIEKFVENLDEEKSVQQLAENTLPLVAEIAFDYLIMGIDYMDLIQEGSIGVMKGLNEYRISNKNILEYIKLWARREMIIYVNNKIEMEKATFIDYLLKAKEKILEEQSGQNLNSLDNDILNKRIKIINENIEKIKSISHFDINKKLKLLEEKVLKSYYGLENIEKTNLEMNLNLKNAEREKILEKAIFKISLGGGQSLKI